MMQLWPIRKLCRVEHMPGGAGKSDALLRAGQHREQSAAKGALREVRRVVGTAAAYVLHGMPQPESGAVGCPLVVAENGSDARVVGERGGAEWSRQHVNGPALGELRDQRRRENDVAEKARLDNERSRHSVDLQHREKRLLRNLNRSHLLHALLSLLLLLEKLSLARDVAAVALGKDVLAQRLDAGARDDFRSDRRLNRDLEQLARNEVLELVGDLAPPLVGLVLVDDDAECVDGITVDQHVELHQIAAAVLEHLVVERRVAATYRLQLVEEVEDDLAERELPIELDAFGIE